MQELIKRQLRLVFQFRLLVQGFLRQFSESLGERFIGLVAYETSRMFRRFCHGESAEWLVGFPHNFQHPR